MGIFTMPPRNTAPLLAFGGYPLESEQGRGVWGELPMATSDAVTGESNVICRPSTARGRIAGKQLYNAIVTF